MIDEIVIHVMEWIGTIAFAVSGALVAIKCSLDLFGVLIVGCVTAVGGGITRDLLLGRVPPQIFFSPYILFVALITSLGVFAIAYIYRKKFESLRERIESINVFFDALGLAAFSITGVEIACGSGYTEHVIFTITLGVLTGVGGGVLRDVLVNEKPYVLTRHVYAVASIVGCLVYYVMRIGFDYRVIGTFAAVGVTIVIRLLAARFHWKLPKIKF
ncbi:MAG: trimeric intracellular cation channel family protein [Clostridia bacterium]|nr:trimeric intracellular cation channel family protein [Clostridia bacterium]